MFLSVITRTCRRPKALAACLASLEAQECRDFEHVLIRDDEGHDVGWANGMMAERDWSSLLHGEWVYILDDDNAMEPGAIQAIKDAADGHDMLIFKADLRRKEPYPPGEYWRDTPQRAKIDAGCVVLRSDLFKLAITGYQPAYDGDFDYIAAAYGLARSVGWVEKIIMRAQRISHGAFEV